MDSKTCQPGDGWNSGHHKCCKHRRNVGGINDVIQLSAGRLDEGTALGPSELLAAGMAFGHSCATTLFSHSLAASMLGDSKSRTWRQTRHNWRGTHEESQGNHRDFDEDLQHRKFTATQR